MAIESLADKLNRLARERQRLASEEEAVRAEAHSELARLNDEIDLLEERKEQLEAYLGLNGTPQRAAHGQISQLCLTAVADSGVPVSSAEIRELIEKSNPGLKLTSVPGTLSRLVSQGRLQRNDAGKYSLV
jgi:hypothetical protein